ncbi:MAG: hypothetical protein OEX00_08750, partial [Gammaproteobacteria bacterium]|nr:hypothetical protein [Gammaproteobacteria bacterium]
PSYYWEIQSATLYGSLSVVGDNAEVHFKNHRLNTTWYATQYSCSWNSVTWRYTCSNELKYHYPYFLRGNGDVSVVLKDSDHSKITSLTAYGNWELDWPNRTLGMLPVVDRATFSQSFIRLNEDIYIQNARIEYDNFWGSYYGGAVDWAATHGRAFSLKVSLDTRLALPTDSGYTQTRNVSTSLGLYVPRSSFSNRVYSISFGIDGESIFLSHSTKSRNNLIFSNQLGTVMELVLNEDRTAIEGGMIWQDDNLVARIEDSRFGPIIRYINGNMESF